MAWRELSVVEQREEFVRLAMMPGANISELCRRFGISRDTGHRTLKRHAAQGQAGLSDRSRRPHASPSRTVPSTEAEILRIRSEHNNAWGARKIARVMERSGFADVPALSTITEVLRRHGKLGERASRHRGPFIRFEREAPNELWQMDFKGHFALARGRCHPLTAIDDHSRFALVLDACADEQEKTVRERLTAVFRRYGMPFAMLTDNGPPWGSPAGWRHTTLSVWLMRLGIEVHHGRPYHPQTQGKDERFHRTIDEEVLNGNSFADHPACQVRFDRFRHTYNYERPHDALALETPSSRYRSSMRSFPETLPDVVYWPGDLVRKVDSDGFISLKNRPFRIGQPFRKQLVALRATNTDGCFDVFFCAIKIAAVDLARPKACGFVDIADAMTTTPQAQQKSQLENPLKKAKP
jgi:transposase InsO family protein